MKSKERKSGNRIKNIKRVLKNSRTRLQVNWYLLFQREKENLEWKQMFQNMQLEEFYLRNKRKSGNLSHSY